MHAVRPAVVAHEQGRVAGAAEGAARERRVLFERDALRLGLAGGEVEDHGVVVEEAEGREGVAGDLAAGDAVAEGDGEGRGGGCEFYGLAVAGAVEERLGVLGWRGGGLHSCFCPLCFGAVWLFLEGDWFFSRCLSVLNEILKWKDKESSVDCSFTYG